MAETTSSIYATPVITDLYADGYKEIVVPSFVHHLEVFQGDNGAQAAGFPAFHEDKVHASPLLYDIDHDGIQDIVLSTYSGEVLFYQDTGKKLPVALSIPSLPVDTYAPVIAHALPKMYPACHITFYAQMSYCTPASTPASRVRSTCLAVLCYMSHAKSYPSYTIGEQSRPETEHCSR